jgi:hypothetical protein
MKCVHGPVFVCCRLLQQWRLEDASAHEQYSVAGMYRLYTPPLVANKRSFHGMRTQTTWKYVLKTLLSLQRAPKAI